MDVTYAAFSPRGEIPLNAEDLAAPFRISLRERHPFLTLGDYLQGVLGFILKDQGRLLLRILASRHPEETSPGHLESLRICTQKHGALYHVASVEVRIDEERLKLCASTAVSDQAREWLVREVEILNALHRRFGLPCLPVPLAFAPVSLGSGERRAEAGILVADWFEGFCEWHLRPNPCGRTPEVWIWDPDHGERRATPNEATFLFEECARILTRCYDPGGRRQIRAWHHAAGDFVVRPRNGKLEVRLTTARRYEPLFGMGPEDGLPPAAALVYFFLDTALRMRLDRADGVGRPQWAGEETLEAAIRGFLRGLAERKGSSMPLIEQGTAFLDLLRSFSSKELLHLHAPVLEGLRADPAERALIEGRLDAHVKTLHRALREARE